MCHHGFCWNHSSETALVFQGQGVQSYCGGVLTQPTTSQLIAVASRDLLWDWETSLTACSLALCYWVAWRIDCTKNALDIVLAKGCVLNLVVQQEGSPSSSVWPSSVHNQATLYHQSCITSVKPLPHSNEIRCCFSHTRALYDLIHNT